MPSTKDLELKHIKCLLYGRTGIGKTTLLGTAPKPFIIATEDGLTPLARHSLEYIRIQKSEELRQLWLMLSKSDYETVCIDSLSALSDMLLAEIETETGTDEARTTYPLLRSKLWKIISGYLKLPKHVIMTATETRSDDKPVLPSVHGAKLCEDIARIFDFVHFMDFGKDDNVIIYTSRHRYSVAKDRTGELGREHPYHVAYFEDMIRTVVGEPANLSESREKEPNPKTKPKAPKPDRLEGTENDKSDNEDEIPFDL